uniref:Putative ovule protein n=1 Tax=Solanum chacoense TaxID=4108 RepID=A0A0V0HZ80_SOLCH
MVEEFQPPFFVESSCVDSFNCPSLLTLELQSLTDWSSLLLPSAVAEPNPSPLGAFPQDDSEFDCLGPSQEPASFSTFFPHEDQDPDCSPLPDWCVLLSGSSTFFPQEDPPSFSTCFPHEDRDPDCSSFPDS